MNNKSDILEKAYGGFAGFLTGWIGVSGVILFFTLMMLAGSLTALRLPDPESMVPGPERVRKGLKYFSFRIQESA